MKKVGAFIIVVMLSLVGISCKKKTPTPTPDPIITPAAVDINSTPQISYILLSSSKSFTYTSGSGSVLDNSSNSGSLSANTKYYSSYIYKGAQIFLNINKGCMPSGSASTTNSSLADSTKFKNFFPVGYLTYSAQGANPISGIEITMKDSLGTVFSTSNGPQTSCTFHIDDTQASKDANGVQQIKIKASFTCILYNQGSTQPSKGISNGIYIGYFQNQ